MKGQLGNLECRIKETLFLLQQEMLELQQKIDHIQWRSDMMSKKIKDMASSTAMMTRVVHATGEDIAELE